MTQQRPTITEEPVTIPISRLIPPEMFIRWLEVKEGHVFKDSAKPTDDAPPELYRQNQKEKWHP